MSEQLVLDLDMPGSGKAAHSSPCVAITTSTGARLANFDDKVYLRLYHGGVHRQRPYISPFVVVPDRRHR